MNYFNKENKKTFFKVTIGHLHVYFTNQEEAMQLYKLLSSFVSRVTIENKMIDKFNGIDFGGYEYLHFVKENWAVSLSTEEKVILSPEEVAKIADKRRAEKEAFEAKKPKAKK